jgi:hypothetical protein
LQRQLKDLGVKMMTEADESPTGPASFMIVDPDANTIIEKSVSAVGRETLEVKAIRAWHSALSGGALSLPNLQTNDCPLPNLQICSA